MIQRIINKLSTKKFVLDRDFLASQYISGAGIEIGALHHPLPVNPKTTTVKYVDRMKVEDLRKQYPELNDAPLVPVDFVADGELLESVSDASQDFVIANHFLEHCQNPILAISNMCRVLRKDGIVFLAVPDKRFTFDLTRDVTPISHLVEDYERGPQWSKEIHFREWVIHVNKTEGEENINKSLADLLAMDYSIHFHVWKKTDMDEFLIYLVKQMNFDFEIVLSFRSEGSYENLYILKKTA